MKKCHLCSNRIWPWQLSLCFKDKGLIDKKIYKKHMHIVCLLRSIPNLNNRIGIAEKYSTLIVEPLRKTIPELEIRISEQEDYRTLIVEPFREETTRIVQEMISNSPKIKKPSTKTTKGSKKTKVAVKTKRSLTTKQLEEEATKILKKEKKKRK